MYNILVLHHNDQYPPRASVLDHTYCFERYAPHRCFYVNLAVRSVPAWVRQVPFDMIVFHTGVMSRWNREAYARKIERLRWLAELPAVRVALPQDEFLNADLLCRFINEVGVDVVFSVAPESEWPTIYRDVDREKVRFHNVLTGYLTEETLSRIEKLSASRPERTVDIGYRAWRAAPWLGRHGILKTRIAEVFQEWAPGRSVAIDISTRQEDTFFGDSWYEFLLRCKYQIGVEGGASLLDWDGSLRACTDAYTASHPRASFEEVEAACFPGLDGNLRLFALSPRHLEACATRTAQILVEGEYNGVLRPGDHYIELKRDFSNLDEVLTLVKNDEVRRHITESAYRDIVQSGAYTYRSFVALVIQRSIGHLSPAPASLQTRLLHRWARLQDRGSWLQVAAALRAKKALKSLLPGSQVARLRAMRDR